LDILIESLQDEKDREMRIGILEDSPSICDMLQVALELAGHRVSVYYKSSTFLATVIPPEHAQTTQASFDLLIIDLVLPEAISGLQVVHYVKMAYPDLPILLISAASRLRIEAALEDLPGVNALRKPFKVSDLLAAIQMHTSAP
jgi:DNA-binding response OmpR family regulator